MNTALVQVKDPVPVTAAAEKTPRCASRAHAAIPPLRLRTVLSLPVAAAIAIGIHLAVSKNELPPETRSYSRFLVLIFGLSVVASCAQPFWSGLRRWMAHMFPILAAAV